MRTLITVVIVALAWLELMNPTVGNAATQVPAGTTVQRPMVAQLLANQSMVYTVRPGDTLNAIATRFNTTVAALLAANPAITNPNVISVGQQLVIPDPQSSEVYTVMPGDTLSAIAARFNTTVAALLAANPAITDPNTILVGQQVRIPGTSTQHVNIYMIALNDNGQTGPRVGCGDSVVPVQITIAQTSTPLRAALDALLSVKTAQYGPSGLYNSLYSSTLTVQSITLQNGKATIYLVGQFSLAGDCDDPRVVAQIEQTALQFPTVQQVTVFIDGRQLPD